jgi:hypothetical protein
MIARGKTPAETGKGPAPHAGADVAPTPQLDALLKADPDLVDRIFDYAVKLMPEISQSSATRSRRRCATSSPASASTSAQGCGPGLWRRSSRVSTAATRRDARELGIGRATVYRKLKQAGGKVR